MNDIIKQSNNKESHGRNSNMRKNLNTEILNNDLSKMQSQQQHARVKSSMDNYDMKEKVLTIPHTERVS